MPEETNDKTMSPEELAALEKFIHGEDSTDKAFKSQSGTDALQLLARPHQENLESGSLLLDVPSRIFVLGFASAYQGCKEHHYEEGKELLSLLAGLLPSVKAKRTESIIEAIIGERKWKEGQQQQGGMMGRLRNWIKNP